jgi:flagellar hook-associated protein 3 FlgL
MRVSTGQIYDSSASSMSRGQSSLYKLSSQLSSGRRILSPADDPVASARALVLTQSQQVNEQYADNQGNASSQLGLVDSQLTSLTNLLQNVRDRVVQAGNSALNSSDRQSIATDIESSFSALIGIANSQNGAGDYLFSGYQGGTLPFALASPLDTASTVAYSGDDGQRLLQVSASRQMAVNVAGSDLFMNQGAMSDSIFQTIQNLIVTVKQIPGTSTNLGTQLTSLDQSLANVSRVQTTVGASMRELDNLGSNTSALDIQYKSTLSDLQDLNYTQAISDYTMQNMSLEAAQKSFVKISGLSLFNYL